MKEKIDRKIKDGPGPADYIIEAKASGPAYK